MSRTSHESFPAAKKPAIQFYIGDWRKDPAVSGLTYAARGLWLEMLFLMHESPHRGYLLIGAGMVPSVAQLTRATHGNDVRSVSRLLAELEESGVFSRNTPGTDWYREGLPQETIVSRRMVRDELNRKQWTANGKSGGSPALGVKYNTPGYVYAFRRLRDGAVKCGISVAPERRFYRLKYAHGELETLATAFVDDMGAEEAAIHSKYKHCSDGEWFKMTPEEVLSLVSTLKGKDKGNGKGTPHQNPLSSSSTSTSVEKTTTLPPPPTPSQNRPAAAGEAVSITRIKAKTLINVIAPAHAKLGAPGDIERAITEATTQLTTRQDLESAWKELRENHTKACESWAADIRRRGDKAFVPHLFRWLASGECWYPPALKAPVAKEDGAIAHGELVKRIRMGGANGTR